MTEEFITRIDQYVDQHRAEILEDLRALIRIPSVARPGSPEPMPFGPDVARALDKALAMAAAKGMRTENHGNWYGLAKQGSGKHTIGIFSHLDVVEVDDRWIYPPFDLTFLDGYMIGRGSNDDKLAAVIGLHVGKAMQELSFGNNIELQLYLGCCEEKGMLDLDRYLSEQEQPEFSMVPDFLFPVSVGESGNLKFTLKKALSFAVLRDLTGGKPGNRMPLTASVCYTGSNASELLLLAEKAERILAQESPDGLLLMAEGKNASGFGATDAVNAIEVLLTFLDNCGLLPDEDAAAVSELAAMTRGSAGEAFGIAYADPLYGSLSCRCMELETTATGLSLHYTVRFPGSFALDVLTEEIRSYSDAHQYALYIARCSSGSKVDADDPRVLLINDCRNEVTGKSDAPWAGGGTYAGRLKNAVAFGPKETDEVPILPPGHGWLHGPDEAMNIEDAMNAVKIYIRAVAALDEYYGK